MTIAGTVIQNVLARTLPPAFITSLALQPGDGASLAYSAIPTIPALTEPLRTEVRHAFARATRAVWLAMLGVAGAGLASTLLMREEAMKKSLDERWGLEQARGSSGTLEEHEMSDSVRRLAVVHAQGKGGAMDSEFSLGGSAEGVGVSEYRRLE